VIVTVICTINHISQDLFYADKCIRRLLVNKLELNTVKTIDEFWNYLNRFNHELYRMNFHFFYVLLSLACV